MTCSPGKHNFPCRLTTSHNCCRGGKGGRKETEIETKRGKLWPETAAEISVKVSATEIAPAVTTEWALPAAKLQLPRREKRKVKDFSKTKTFILSVIGQVLLLLWSDVK